MTCVVTRAMSKVEQELEEDGPDDVGVEAKVLSLSDFPLAVSPHELIQEQQGDPLLKELFDRVLPEDEVNSVASGYFFCSGLLFKKWVALGADSVKEVVFQFVVPAQFCAVVFNVAHDDCGHFGVRKTYLNILKDFFLAVWKKGCVRLY